MFLSVVISFCGFDARSTPLSSWSPFFFFQKNLKENIPEDTDLIAILDSPWRRHREEGVAVRISETLSG